MSFPTSALDALQQAGAAVFEADARLKSLAQDYAQQVHEAVHANAFHLGNDSLFENWKTVARMSQTLSGMEQELRQLYQLAGDMAQQRVAAAVPVLLAPAPTPPVELVQPINVTDVRIKKQPRPSPARQVRAAAKPGRALMSGNAARLLAYLERHLNTRTFAAVNQTAASHATGIPLGSMSAAIKKLLADGKIRAGAPGQYLLLG